MTERVVSVKMPKSLVSALDKLREQHHYLDLSEQLRSIVRQKCLEHTNPYTQEIKRLREDLASEGSVHSAKEQVINDLLKMLREEKR